MQVTRAELALCSSVGELEFGILMPVALPDSPRQEVTLPAPFVQMIHACRAYGVPTQIKVADGRPVYGTFQVETDVGPAEKRIQFT